MRAHFINVGQADSTLLEFPCGAILVDTGAELNDDFDGVAALQAYLEAFFANRTDLKGRLTGSSSPTRTSTTPAASTWCSSGFRL